MKLSAKIYAVFISVIGISLGICCVIISVNNLIIAPDLRTKLISISVSIIILVLSRCLPIYIRPDYAIDMGFIGFFAVGLIMGPYLSTALIFISSLFLVVPSPGPEKKYEHIFNTAPIKTAFNLGNYSISIFFGGKVFIWTGGVAGVLTLPGTLFPAMAMVITIFLINSILLNILFKLHLGAPLFASVIKYCIDFLPSVFAAAPIGYFIAMFMSMKSGEYLVILFILPLLLTRFAFTLYIETKRNYYIVLKTLTYSIEAKDEYTRGHSERVEKYAKIIAKEMHFSHGRIENIAVAALLHDVGKIGVDESILKKPASLSNEERALIEKHPEISVQILKEVKLSPVVFEMILHHHERFDGTGYPFGKKGEDLPIDVFVLSVADTYDAMTSTRPYSPGLLPEDVLQTIINEKGKQFHPKVVDAFVRAYGKGKMTLIARDSERDLFFV